MTRPDLSGGYDEVPPQRGPSSAGATVSTDPAGAGPGTPLDLAGYAAHGPDGQRGTLTGSAGLGDAAVLLVDGDPVALRSLVRVDHRERVAHLDAWPN